MLKIKAFDISSPTFKYQDHPDFSRIVGTWSFDIILSTVRQLGSVTGLETQHYDTIRKSKSKHKYYTDLDFFTQRTYGYSIFYSCGKSDVYKADIFVSGHYLHYVRYHVLPHVVELALLVDLVTELDLLRSTRRDVFHRYSTSGTSDSRIVYSYSSHCELYEFYVPVSKDVDSWSDLCAMLQCIILRNSMFFMTSFDIRTFLRCAHLTPKSNILPESIIHYVGPLQLNRVFLTLVKNCIVDHDSCHLKFRCPDGILTREEPILQTRIYPRRPGECCVLHDSHASSVEHADTWLSHWPLYSIDTCIDWSYSSSDYIGLQMTPPNRRRSQLIGLITSRCCELASC